MFLRQRITLSYGALALLILGVGAAALLVLGRAAPALGDAPDAARFVARARMVLAVATAGGALAAALLGWNALRALRRTGKQAAEAVALDPDDPADVDIGEDDPFLHPLHEALAAARANYRQRTVPRAHLDDILDSMNEVLLVVGSGGQVRRANRAATQTLGYGREELRALTLGDLLPEAHDAAGDARPGSPTGGEGTLCCKDGSSLPVLFSCAPLRSDHSGERRTVCVAQDISERTAARKRLRASLEEKEVLLREIHHRVKNNLQVISSLLSLQSDDLSEPAERLLAESRRRIRSMALVHERLYRSGDLARIDFEDYLDELGRHLVRAYGAGHVRFRSDVRAGPLDVRRAIPLGLLTNELVANALEHAFSENGVQPAPSEDATPTVRLQFFVGDDTATLRVEDNGRGLLPGRTPGDLEASDSLGLRLVRALAGQLGGSLEIEDKGSGSDAHGLRFTVAFPYEEETPV